MGRWVAACLALLLGLTGGASFAGPAARPAAEEPDGDVITEANVRGVELGQFRVRAYYPVDAQKSSVRFVLHMAVAADRFSTAGRLVDSRRHKVRDQVITVTRMTPLVLYDEPDLTSFRRRILLRLRRTLPELAIEDVYISDFQLTVQSL